MTWSTEPFKLIKGSNVVDYMSDKVIYLTSDFLQFLAATSSSIAHSVGWLVGWGIARSVGPTVH